MKGCSVQWEKTWGGRLSPSQTLAPTCRWAPLGSSEASCWWNDGVTRGERHKEAEPLKRSVFGEQSEAKVLGRSRNPGTRESPRVKQGVIGRVGLGSRSPCVCCHVGGRSKGTFSSFPLLQPVVHLFFLQQVNGFRRVWGFWFYFKHWIPGGNEENTLYLICPV